MKEIKLTFEDLNKVKYGDLEETFTELGIPGAWKPGTKKKVLIEEALAQLRDLKELVENGMSEEEAKKKLLIKSQERKLAEQIEKEKRKKELEVKEVSKATDLMRRIKRMKLSDEQLQYNLRNIRGNLKNAPSGPNRLILLQKEAAIEAILAEEKK
jgi:hypothetical protein